MFWRAMAIVSMLSSPALAQGDTFKASVPMLLKVLSYDTNFDARGIGDLVVLVVATSRDEKKLIAGLNALLPLKVKNRSVKFASIEFKDEAALQAEIEKSHAGALLASPDLPLESVNHLWEVTQDNQIYALALDVAMVEQVLPLGVSNQDGKTQIVINEKSAKLVGAKFETTVLKLARVIQ